MIVEVFKKGTNFKEFIDTYWRVEGIGFDNTKYILITEWGKDNIILSADKYELQVSY